MRDLQAEVLAVERDRGVEVGHGDAHVVDGGDEAAEFFHAANITPESVQVPLCGVSQGYSSVTLGIVAC
ncbi:hypothetical protein GCM10018963_36260 [Saccharothrix longispora]